MPNYCGYEMRIVGEKSDRDTFLKRMRNYEEQNHFYRIFEADIYEEGEDYCCICGDCAWSIESCCRASGYSGGRDLLAINSEELNLKVEVWSEEEGVGFQEHYIYDKGKCLVDECVDWNSYYTGDYESAEEMNKECGTEFTQEEFESPNGIDGCCIIIGGFENYNEWTI